MGFNKINFHKKNIYNPKATFLNINQSLLPQLINFVNEEIQPRIDNTLYDKLEG